MRQAKIETYPCFLNVAFLETGTDRIVPIAYEVLNRIERLGETRRQDLELEWDPRVRPGTLGAAGRTHYQPKLYVVSGTFDVGAVYLSPALELATWTQSEELLVAGQDVNVCMLPTAASLWPGKREKDGDFNRDLLEAYGLIPAGAGGEHETAEPVDQRREYLPPELAFLSVTKIKLSPLVSWPEPEKEASDEIGVMPEILRTVWEQIEKWRSSTRVGPGRKPPLVALGLSCGWNELLVVAHADDPGKLLRLSLLLRQPHLEVQVTGEDGQPLDKNHDHLVLTSLTRIGHDLQIRIEAQTRLKKEASDWGPIEAGRLVALAQEVGANGNSYTGEGDGRLSGLFFQIGCLTYPGHERDLLHRLEDLRKALPGTPPALSPAEVVIEASKRDLWTPAVSIGPEGVEPRAAMALIGMIQEWVRNGGRMPASTGLQRRELIPDAFDFTSRIACVASDAEELGLAEVPDDHVEGVPHRHFPGPRLTHKLHGDGTHPAPELVEQIRRAMGVLQLPYPLAEQILNVVNMFLWSSDRGILWDESLELVSPVLALASYLEGRARWWRREHLRVGQLYSIWVDRREATLGRQDRLAAHHEELINEQMSEIRQQLQRSEADLMLLGQAFRAYSYNAHHLHSLTGEISDKGSVHQLLRIANMILDALTDVVLGPRACMAIIGDGITPEVTMPCHVTVVQLNSAAFTMPVMLETLAHEVAHQFLRELVRDSQTDGGWRQDTWVKADHYPGSDREREDRRAEHQMRRKSYEGVRQTFHVVNRQLFGGGLANEDDEEISAFVESASDFLEMRLFDYDFDHWLQSFTLRAVLAAKPLSLDLRNDDRRLALAEVRQIDVPSADHRLISSILVRAVLVFIADRLSRADESVFEDLQGFKQDLLESCEEVRRLLSERCVLGPRSPVLDWLRSPERWRRFVREDILNSMRWLSDRYALESVSYFYAALRAHADWRGHESQLEGYQGTGRLWSTIRDAFRTLWRGRADDGSEGIQNRLLPSLYVRHWMQHGERHELRWGEAKPSWESSGFGSWRADIQPLSHQYSATADKPLEVHTLIFQRGGIRPATPEAQEAWEEAHRRWLVQLLLMVPAWRRAILAKIELVLGT